MLANFHYRQTNKLVAYLEISWPRNENFYPQFNEVAQPLINSKVLHDVLQSASPNLTFNTDSVFLAQYSY
jgi:hypothetical protein